jgi:hypothetical protein
MKRLKELAAVAVLLLSVTLFTGCGTYVYGTSAFQPRYENPQWAPSYYDGARYYYLPDLECYFDIYAREFVFLNNGQWMYSSTFPSIYSDFDLNNSFVVVLNSNIYQPWMHHQYYVSHYPRYYYRDYYDHSNIPYVRGFNENNRSAIYWSQNERNRARSWDDVNLRNGRRFSYSKEDRQQQRNMNNQTRYRQSPDNTILQKQANIEEKRRSDATNYYGRPIGQPVKARKQMRIPNTAGTTNRSSNRSGNQRNRSGNSNDQNRQNRR